MGKKMKATEKLIIVTENWVRLADLVSYKDLKKIEEYLKKINKS